MKKNVLILLTLCISMPLLWAQDKFVHDRGTSQLLHNQHVTSSAQAFQAELAPFYHGVASGDPLQTQVIIWTRVSPDSLTGTGTLSVSWRIATDTLMENVIQSGVFETDSSRDYTVKIDVEGLTSNTTYYYNFEINGRNSLIGRTKTLPDNGEAEHLRFAIVSCSNYEAGFFNAYGRIADRNDLDAVLHLGDYIYEYGSGVYGDSNLIEEGIRQHDPFETVELDQYRMRYSLYRLDPDLRAVHQQQTFICIWDDHESANDAYVDGAENHDPNSEGDWETRKAVAKQAYFEWIPIRENDEQDIFRKFSFGGLADLIMLDTRLEGRQQQIASVTDSLLFAEDRTMLGEEQLDWFFNAIDSADATWKIIGNQVIFSELYVGWAALADPTTTPEEFESIFLDIWDGYPAERNKIISYIDSNQIDNVTFVTGDFHSAFAYDVAQGVVDEANFYAPTPNYVGATGEGSKAIEFITPSINSANFDENLGAAVSAGFEVQFNNPLPVFNTNPNPHMKYVDLDRHGYFILDVKSDSIKANWYFVDRIDSMSTNEDFDAAMVSFAGTNRLDSTVVESEEKAIQQDPAPNLPPGLTTSLETVESNVFAIMALYPNPAGESSMIQYALNNASRVSINIYDLQGKLVKEISDTYQTPGIYDLQINTTNLAAGLYNLLFKIDNKYDSRKLLIK